MIIFNSRRVFYATIRQVWVSLFLDLWRRRNNAIAFRWGVEGVEDEELMRVQAARVRVLCVRVPRALPHVAPVHMVPRM